MRVSYIILTTLVALVQPLLAEELKITPRHYTMIAELESYLDMPFPEFFAKLSGHSEVCGEHLEKINCEAPLRKFTDEIEFTLAGGNALKNDNRFDHVGQSLVNALNQLSKGSGIKLALKDRISDSATNYIFLLYVEPSSYQENPRQYIEEYIVTESFSTPVKLAKTFQQFFNSGQPCFVLIASEKNYGTYAAHIWVRTDLSDHAIAKCTFEELYNAYGLSEFDSIVSAITDWPFIWNAEHEMYTEFALFLMQILYSDHMKVGQDRSATIRELKRIIALQ